MKPADLLRIWTVSLPARTAWLSALVSVLISIGALISFYQMADEFSGIRHWLAIVSALTSVVLLAILIKKYKDVTTTMASRIFLLNAYASLLAIYAENQFYAVQADHWAPFQASKLGCLLAALLAPRFGTGLLVIASYAGLSVWQYWGFAPDVRERLTFGEPRALVAFGVAGMLLLTFRFGQVILEQRVVAAHAEASAIKVLANSFLRFRDMMNTPLQTLDLGLALLRDKNGKSEPEVEVLERMSRAVYSLRDINGLLVQYEKSLDWGAISPYDHKL